MMRTIDVNERGEERKRRGEEEERKRRGEEEERKRRGEKRRGEKRRESEFNNNTPTGQLAVCVEEGMGRGWEG
jgi:hypothetical protein